MAKRTQSPQRADQVEKTSKKVLQRPVEVTPGKAIEVAGALHSRAQFAETAEVCRQVIDAIGCLGE